MKFKLPFLTKKNKKEKNPVPKEENKLKLETNTTESIFERNKKNIKDLIAPEYIDFTTSPKYMMIGNKYYAKNVYIGLLPNSVGFASFLHKLYNFGNIDVSIFVNPIDPETAKAELSKLKTNLEVELLSAGGSTNRFEDMQVKVAEAQRLRNEVRDGYNKIYEACIVATLYEEDLRALNNAADRLKGLLAQSDIGLKNAIYVQEEVFRSNKPFNTNLLKEYHTFDKRSLACIFPFTSNNINHEDGVMIGLNMDNHLPIFFNNFSKQLDNYNVFIFAKSGSGKSTLVKSIAARTATLDTVQNLAIDVEREYVNISKTLGGVNIVIKPETDTIINPFDITPEKIQNEITGKTEDRIILKEKINSVTNVLMAMFKGYTGNPYYDDMARSIIMEGVRKEYERIGITEDPSSLYEYKESKLIEEKLVGGKTKKHMPTISTWYMQIEKMAEKNTNPDKVSYFNYLLEIMAGFTKYKNGSFTCFDGQSTVHLSYDIPFINFDIKSLNEETERPLAQYILCDYIWEQLIKRNVGTGHKIRCIIDEAWMMVGYPEALRFLKTMSKRARKYNASLFVITQQFQDFYNEDTKPIIKNSDTKFFLKPERTDYDDIKEVFKLTEGEINFLRRINRGQCLMKANNISAKVEIEIPELELGFIETNQNSSSYKATFN